MEFQMSLGMDLFDKNTTQLDYEGTKMLVAQLRIVENYQSPSQMFSASGKSITRTGQAIMRMMTTDADQKYIDDHYETESEMIIARYYFSSTTNDLIKTYLMMRWNFQNL